MMEDNNNGLIALEALRSKLDASAHLEVIHEGGEIWKAHFTFDNPTTVEDIQGVKRQLHLSLPPNYEQFLLHYNGALLYHDDIFGQWGFQLYGTGDLISANMDFKKRHADNWPPTYFVFAKSLGDTDRLILDTAQSVDNGRDCPVVDGDSGYLPQEWKIAARSFSDWLDRLVVAQGAKYWQWY